MALVVEKYLEQFDRNFDEIKVEAYQQMSKEYTIFMKDESTSRAFVKKSYMGGLGLPRKNRSLQPIPFDEPVKGPTAFYQPVQYRLGYSIERDLIEDEQWGILGQRPMNMLYGSTIIMDMAATDILNNGTVLQSYDFGGKALFATDHAREDGNAVWSNRNTVGLPITVETVFQIIADYLYNLKDSRGFPIAYSGTYHILVPSTNATLWRQAVEVVNSVMNPNTSDNRINATTSTFRLEAHALRFLSNEDRWFICWDTSSPNYGLTMVTRHTPDITPLTPFNDNPDCWFSRLRQKFVAGYENKRGIVAVG